MELAPGVSSTRWHILLMRPLAMTTNSCDHDRASQRYCATATRRALHSNKSIKKALNLQNDVDYVKFYTATEQIIKTHGLIQSTFRTISEKETVRKNISELVLADLTLCEVFPATIRSMSGPQGRDAFGFLVYKICSNFRRRTRRDVRPGEDQSVDVGGRFVASLAGVPERPTSARNISPPLAIAPSAWQGMVSVVHKDGAFKALCRLCELSHHWPEGKLSSEYSIDELAFDRFMVLLRSDHGFHNNDDQIAWSRDLTSTDVDSLSIIDNERQWRAVVADLLQHGRSLTFSVVHSTRASERY